jgi:D-alanyl-D-alanine carboxypeptidase/D-alanyl-D-alanine-endopeptidase (penicillin-binding protein 4)
MNKESDNLSAENLLKILAAEKGGIPGTGEAGIAVMKEHLISIGIDTTNIVIADGSGVSRYNLTSANVIVQLLQNMYRTQEHFDALYHSLPVAGVDGSLQKRMKGSTAQGNLRAKTGTLTGVSSLSGYVYTEDEKLLAFAMLMQNYITNAKYYRQVQDRIGIFLSNLDLDGF